MVILEVETKSKIPDSEVKALRERIKKIGTFVKAGKKSDDYFALKRKGFPKKAFRIRNNVKGKFEVNFKKHMKQYYDDKIVVKQEFEFELENKEHVENLLALFRDLNFVEWVKKIKKNETYRYKKDKRLMIEINKVKHLGYFMEIEYLCKEWEIKKAKRKIREVLKILEIKDEWFDNTGYTRMLWNKGIKDKRYWI